MKTSTQSKRHIEAVVKVVIVKVVVGKIVIVKIVIKKIGSL